MMPNLYDVTEDILKLEALMEEADGDEAMVEALTEALDDQAETFEAKAANVMYMLRNWKGQAEAIKLEEERLAKRRKVYENKATRLTAYMLAHMQRVKRDKITTTVATASIRKGSESVIIDDDLALPQGYFTTSAVIKPDKAALKALWKETEEEERTLLPGFRVERGAATLTIK